MKRLFRLLCTVAALCWAAYGSPAPAAEMTFRLINDTERPLSMKLFSHGDSHQEWPSKTKMYTLRPDAAVQQLKINCVAGEEICWGAWMAVENVSGMVGGGGNRTVRKTTYITGAGLHGIRACTYCCHVCTEGMMTPVRKLNDPDKNAR